MKQQYETSMAAIKAAAKATKIPTNKGALAQRNAFFDGQRAFENGHPLKVSKKVGRVVRAAFRKGWHTAKRAQS